MQTDKNDEAIKKPLLCSRFAQESPNYVLSVWTHMQRYPVPRLTAIRVFYIYSGSAKWWPTVSPHSLLSSDAAPEVPVPL